MKTCAVCGASNEAEAAFCGTCGAKLDAPAPEQPAAPEAVTPAPPGDDAVVPGAASTGPAVADAGKVAPGPPAPPPPISPPPTSPSPPPLRPPASAAAPNGTICPNCGTLNEPQRAFCKKCATDLRPAPAARKYPVDRGWVVRFLTSMTVSLVVVAGGAMLLLRPASAAPGPTAAPVGLVDDAGAELDMGLVPDDPEPLPPLPPDSTIQLVSYKAAAATTAPDGEPKAPWWNDTVPRVPAVTQFDGGPLQKHNCTMASGAMLARLAFGIVTTGSQLRSLQDDQDGSSSFGNVNQALKRGWGVKLNQGALSPLQFRALLYAGAGAMVSVNYGEIPVGVRLQESYTGGHVIYIDAFRPPGDDGPAAYFVIDPIGHSWQGYVGQWWPAADVERAATARYNGKMATAWAFAGGVVPQSHKNLPFDAYPDASQPPSGDPMPSGDLPIDDPSDGENEPETPIWTVVDITVDAYLPQPGRGMGLCLTQPPPLGCPIGIIGVFDVDGLSIPNVNSPPGIDILFGGTIAPDTYQIIFGTPPGSAGSLWLWNSAGGRLEQAAVMPGLLKGQPVSIATLTLDPGVDYSFMATATGNGIRSMSSVGSLAQP